METDLVGGRSAAHCCAVVCANLRASEGVGEHVERDVIGIRPHAELRIIGELAAAIIKCVPIVRAGRIRRRRDSNTLQIRCRRDGELRKDPTIIDLVVFNNWIAVVIVLTTAAESVPQRFSGYWAKYTGAGGFIEHGE